MTAVNMLDKDGFLLEHCHLLDNFVLVTIGVDAI